MLSNPHRAYIFRSVGLWLLMFLAGAVLLFGVRQYGKRMTAWRDANLQVTGAMTLYEQGALYDCQRAINIAMNTSPEIARVVSAAFRGALIALPSTQERLDASALDVFAEAQLRYVQGDITRAKALFAKAAMTPKAYPEARLWLGRLALDEGDIHQAKGYFDAYWASSSPPALDPATTPSTPGEIYQRGRHLFSLGLWKEAFMAFVESRRQGFSDPGLRCFEGVMLELDGARDAAVTAYRDTIALAPSHRLALQRLNNRGQ